MESSLVTRFMKAYNETMEQSDPRSLDFPFMSSPIPNAVSTLLYLFIVIYAGPRFMKNRAPFNLRKFVVVYNMAMVVMSTMLFYEFIASGWFTDYSFTCQDCDYSNSPRALRMVRACYFFWLSKHIEFLDTFFFIAHKKTQHISFLHVFHHTLMAFTWWWGVRFSPGGLGTFHAVINSLVHMVMYLYYGIAAMGPKYQKYIWWKKYLTGFQMTQFVVVFGHMTNIILFHDCKYPQIFKYIISLYGTLFFILFANFWIQAYTRRSARAKSAVTDNSRKQNGTALSNGASNGTVLSNGASNGAAVSNGTSNGVRQRPVANGHSKHH